MRKLFLSILLIFSFYFVNGQNIVTSFTVGDNYYNLHLDTTKGGYFLKICHSGLTVNCKNYKTVLPTNFEYTSFKTLLSQTFKEVIKGTAKIDAVTTIDSTMIVTVTNTNSSTKSTTKRDTTYAVDTIITMDTSIYKVQPTDTEIRRLFEYCITKRTEYQVKTSVAAAKKAIYSSIPIKGKAGDLSLRDMARVSVECGNTKDTLVFFPTDGYVKTDKNRLSTIHIVGKLNGQVVEWENSKWSIPLTSLNRTSRAQSISQQVHLKYKKGSISIDTLCECELYLDGVLDYHPHNGSFSRIVKNEEFSFTPKDSVTLNKREENDYITATLFTDPFGFLSEDRNTMLQTEVFANIPLNIRNRKCNYLFPQVRSALNYTVINGVEGEQRRFTNAELKPLNDSINVFRVNPLNILHNKNTEFFLKPTLYSVEIKALSSFINVNAGYFYYRSPLDTNTTMVYSPDSMLIPDATIELTQKHIHSPFIELQLESRPDYVLGFDASVALHRLNIRKSGQIDELDVLFIEDAQWVIRNEFNVFMYTGKNNQGGLFFRYRGYHGIKPINDNLNREYYPTIVLGYSTNLRSLIKGN